MSHEICIKPYLYSMITFFGKPFYKHILCLPMYLCYITYILMISNAHVENFNLKSELILEMFFYNFWRPKYLHWSWIPFWLVVSVTELVEHLIDYSECEVCYQIYANIHLIFRIYSLRYKHYNWTNINGFFMKMSMALTYCLTIVFT